MLSILLSICRPARLLRWALLIVVLLAAWMALNYTKLQDYFSARERRNTYRESVARLQKRHEQLTREHAALLAGGFPAEKAIRERLKMIKPGEKVIDIQMPGDKAAPASPPPADPGQSAPSPDKLALKLAEAARQQAGPDEKAPLQAKKARTASEVGEPAVDLQDDAPAPVDPPQKPKKVRP